MAFAQDGVSTDCAWLRNTIWSELALLTSWSYLQQMKTFNIGLRIPCILEGCLEAVMAACVSAL